MDMQYHAPPTNTVEPTVKANRRICQKRRLIRSLFLPFVPGLGEHFLVLVTADFLPSLLDHTTHTSLQKGLSSRISIDDHVGLRPQNAREGLDFGHNELTKDMDILSLNQGDDIIGAGRGV